MDSDTFFFQRDRLPTNGDVFSFINSQTKFGRVTKASAIHDAAKDVFDLWQNADTCPMVLSSIRDKCSKLLKDRETFIRANRTKSFPQSKQAVASEFTRKRRMPSTGRERSKRKTALTDKKEDQTDAENPGTSHDKDVKSLLSNIADSVVAKEVQEESEQRQESMPPKRILLRHVTTPEQKWMTQIGGMLFDVFSNTERQRAKAFDEEFLNDQRHERKMVMDISRVTEEYKAAEAKESERERRSRNYRESATSISVPVPLDFNTDDLSCPHTDPVTPPAEVSDVNFLSGIRTRTGQNSEIENVLKGTCKRSIGVQVGEDTFYPNVSTRVFPKKSKTFSHRVNPRLLAAGSLMMGVAGVTTRQALLCIKISANTLFRQSYILPPSLERDYRKKMKLRRKLAKLDSSAESSTSENIGSTRQAMSDIVSNLADHEDNNPEDIPSPTPGDSDELDAEMSDILEVEEWCISNGGKRELLSRMLCKPSTLRTAHHLISTLGEQQQALEML